MKNQKIILMSLILLAGLAQACATSAEKAIDKKVSEVPSNLKRADLAKEGEMLLARSTDLTEAQKTNLRALWQNSKSQIDDLTKSSLQLRAVLIKDVVATPYDETEVNVVKKKIADVEQKRLSVFFAGVQETNHILGRWGSAMERNNFYQWFTISPDSLSY